MSRLPSTTEAFRSRSGWKDYEWRWESKEFPSKRPNIDALPWRGEDLSGRRLLVFAEQGLGDVIQFVRYLPLLLERKPIVTLLTTVKLLCLLRPLTMKMAVINAIKEKDAYDFQCAPMSLPLRFNTDLSSILSKVPYLAAEEELVARWKACIGEHGFKIGLAWQGNPRAPIDQGRSIPLAEFVPLSRALQHVALHPFDIDRYEITRLEAVRVERVAPYRLAAFPFAQCHASEISPARVIDGGDRNGA
jgi:hypothetical protein